MKRQRGQTATIDVDGTDSGSVNSGGDADLFVFGNDTGAITAAGNINLEASGSFGSTALAGLDANVQVSGNLDSSTITAGTSGTGDAAITGASAAGVNWTAAGTLTADTLGSILVGTLTATTGDVDLTTGGSATVTLSAPGTGGNVNELIVGEALGGASAGEDVNLTTLGGSGQAVTAGQDADVLSAGSLSASAIIAGGEANVETWGGSSAGLVISGVTGANLLAYGSVLPVDDLHPSSITSSAGAVTVMVGGGSVFNATSTTGDLSVLAVGSLGGNFTTGGSGGGGDATILVGGAFVGIVSAGQDVTVLGLSDVSGTFTAAQDSEVVSLGNLEGEVDAGQDAYVLSMGDMGDPIAGQTGTNPGVTINAGRDVYAVSVGDMATTLFAGRNVAQLMSYGSMDIVGSTVAGSIAGVQAWGDISGALSAGTAITSVTSANNVTATTTAPTVGSVTAYQPATGNLPAAPQVTVNDLAASLNAGAIGMAQLTASVLASQAGAGLAANAALANAAIVASQPPVDVGAILAGNAQALGYASQAISTANQEATINLTTQQAAARFAYAQANQTLAGLQAKDQATVANIKTAVTNVLANALKQVQAAQAQRAAQAQTASNAAQVAKDAAETKLNQLPQSWNTWLGNAIGNIETALWNWTKGVLVRAAGVFIAEVQALGSVAEIMAGVAATAETGGLGALAGFYLMANGVDNFVSAIQSIVDGDQHPTMTNQLITKALVALGADPNATSTKLLAGGIEGLLTLGASLEAGAASEAGEVAELSGDAVPVENAGEQLVAAEESACADGINCFVKDSLVKVAEEHGAPLATELAAVAPTSSLGRFLRRYNRELALALIGAGTLGIYLAQRRVRLRRLEDEAQASPAVDGSTPARHPRRSLFDMMNGKRYGLKGIVSGPSGPNGTFFDDASNMKG